MDSPDESKTLTSAFDSPTFGEDSSFRVEQPVGSASISPCGRDVVLASKEGLHIIDLDSPYSPPRYLPHHTSWEVADVQWSPFGSRDYWVVSTSNQKALVWNLAMSSWQDPIEHVLHAHSRAITDINFSAHHPDILATCAVDSFVHCWDLRIPARPAISFSDWFAGATQVKWNRQNSHVIASSHDKCLRIWDDRMGAIPMRSIVAHDTKIYGVDWNRVRPTALATCSLDKTIKIWDYENPEDKPEKIIRTPFPVWRARHTPFAWGLLALPQRGSNDLHLYDRRAEDGAESTPVHTFPGHHGQVKEFLWRPRGNIVNGVDQREFQLVTWGADRELRLHRVEEEVFAAVGHEKGKGQAANINVTRKDAKYKTFRDEPSDQPDYFDTQSVISPGPSQSVYGRHRGSLSIGMSKISIPRARGWVHGHQKGPRIGMNAKTTIRQDMNPIAWMRGVKIAGWDEDTLGEEITQVGERFSKVVFEAVDVRQRRATITLHGPWGPEGNNIFLKVDIKFPSSYPHSAAPTFHVQKTTSVTDQLSTSMSSELRKIASTFLLHKRGCLEAVIRYLLGENTLQDTIAWVEKTDSANKMSVDDTLEDESSSDEDVEGVGGEFQGPDLSMSNSELLRPLNLNVMVPVPKACGAFWAPNGQLVCFFPPKKDKPESFLDSLIGLRDMDTNSRSDKAIFEGFGRLQTRSPGPKPAVGTATTGTDADSDSDESYSSSSSSSGSTDLLTSLPAQFQAPQAWRGGSLGMRRSRSADRSQRSTTAGTQKSASDVPKSIISVHNFAYLLPAKRCLARNYKISGNPPEVCAHNANIAAKSGNQDLARVWGLIKLILQEQVPLEGSEVHKSKDIFLVAQRVMRNIKRKDSGIDLTYDAFDQSHKKQASLKSRTRWGENPLGGRWLVPALFDYFEGIADVQMLAMLSCIFYEPASLSLNELSDSSSLQQSMPAIDSYIYPPTRTIVQGLMRPDAGYDAKPIRARPDRQGSRTSDTWNSSNSPTPYSTGQTPPWPSQSDRSGTDAGSLSKAISVSESPEYRFLRQSNSNLAAAVASSLSRGLSLSGLSGSGSPPSHGSKKRASPAGSFTGLPSINSGGWGSGSRAAKASAIPEHIETSTAVNVDTHSPPAESEIVASQSGNKSKSITITFKNISKFEDDGFARVPLLDGRRQWRYKAYRRAYADLLSFWDLPVAMAEVLKFDGLRPQSPGDFSNISTPERRRSSMSIVGHKTSEKTAPIEAGGLGFQRHCLRCAEPLPQSTAPGSSFSIFLDGLKLSESSSSATATRLTQTQCAKCKMKARIPTKIPCVVCGEFVQGVLVPCLDCGHASCLKCHQRWFFHEKVVAAADGERVQDRECPSGCGCICGQHSVLDIAMFSEEKDATGGKPSDNDSIHTNGTTPTILRPPRDDHRATLGGTADVNDVFDDDDLESWRRSRFANLGRGVGSGLSRGISQDSIRSTSSVGKQSNASRRKR